MRSSRVVALAAVLLCACAPDPYDWVFFDQGSGTRWSSGQRLTVGVSYQLGVTLERFDDRCKAPEGLQVFADDEAAVELSVAGAFTREDCAARGIHLVATAAGANSLQFIADNSDETGTLAITATE